MHDEAAAFAAFVEEDFTAVLCSVTVGLRQPRLAYAATNEAFARAYARWTRRNGSRPPVSSLHIDAVRIALRRAETEPVTASTSEPGTFARAVADLPARERLAIVLRHHAHLSRADLARALRCSHREAAATLHAAYRRLDVEPDDDDEIPEVELDAP